MIKTAIVTGHTSGIGKAVYELLTELGYTTIGVARSAGLICDLADPVSRRELIAVLREMLTDGLDVLVNNAGQLWLNELDRRQGISYLVQLNLISVWDLIVGLKDLFNDDACIINIASVSGIKAEPDAPMYGATKAGVISLTKSFALLLAPKVRVNAISPGFVETNLVSEPLPEEFLKAVPLGFEAKPEHVAHAVKFILENEYLTGANIVIDGGSSCEVPLRIIGKY